MAEKEVIPDLTDTIRLCVACQEWCPRYDMLISHLTIHEFLPAPILFSVTDASDSFT